MLWERFLGLFAKNIRIFLPSLLRSWTSAAIWWSCRSRESAALLKQPTWFCIRYISLFYEDPFWTHKSCNHMCIYIYIYTISSSMRVRTEMQWVWSEGGHLAPLLLLWSWVVCIVRFHHRYMLWSKSEWFRNAWFTMGKILPKSGANFSSSFGNCVTSCVWCVSYCSEPCAHSPLHELNSGHFVPQRS